MIVRWIEYGKSLEKGIDLYNQSQYNEAKLCFLKATKIDDDDFMANFWLLRTLTMLHEFGLAEKLALRCMEGVPDWAKSLVIPWHEKANESNQDVVGILLGI